MGSHPGLRTVEVGKSEVPFEIQLPREAELPAGKPLAFNATLKKTDRATRNMTWLWTGEAPASGLGYRVLGSSQFGQFGQFVIPPDITCEYPAALSLRVVGLDGKAHAGRCTIALCPTVHTASSPSATP